MSEDTPEYKLELNKWNQPQAFGMAAIPSWTSFIFNYKTLSILCILGLLAGIYVLNLQKNNLQLKLDNAEMTTSFLRSENKKCQQNYEKLSKSIVEAAEATVSFNIEIQDLRTQIERYNKINRNNANVLKQLNEYKFAETCEESISELVDAF
jgi:hypothetical protein